MPDETKSQGGPGVDAEPEAAADSGEEETGLENRIDMEELGPCKRKLKVAVPAEKVLEEIEKSYRELGSTLTYPGFRKGHVPRVILEKRFGSQIQDEVKEGLLQTTFEEAISAKALAPLGEPHFDKIEFEVEKPFSFEVTLDVRPEFELGEYKGVQVQEPSVEPTEEEVKTTIDRFLQSRAELVTVEEGVAEEGDYLIADLGLYAGEEKIKLEEEISVPVGGDQIFGIRDPKIRDLLIGAKVDESRELEVEIPADFPEEKHRGQKGRITLAPKEVKRARLPELDDALAEQLGFSSVADFREDVVGKLRHRKGLEKNARVESAILEKIIDALDLPLPEDVIQGEADNVDARQRWRMRQMGFGEKEIDEILQEGRSRSVQEIGRNLREIFVLDKIADAEKIFVTEEEVDQHLQARAEAFGTTLPDLKQQMRQAGELGALRMELRQEKVRAFLREHAETAPRQNEAQEQAK